MHDVPGSITELMAAVVPFRYRHHKLEVGLVSSRTHAWCLPMGLATGSLNPAYVGCSAAWEEGGFLGECSRTCIGSIEEHFGESTFIIRLYPLLVGSELAWWPDGGHRIRKWFSLRDAAASIDHQLFVELILALPFTLTMVEDDFHAPPIDLDLLAATA